MKMCMVPYKLLWNCTGYREKCPQSSKLTDSLITNIYKEGVNGGAKMGFGMSFRDRLNGLRGSVVLKPPKKYNISLL